MLVVQDGKIESYTGIGNKSEHLIVFIDSTECTKCQLDKIARFETINSLAKEEDTFDLMIILSIPQKEYDDITQHLTLADYQIPIFIDHHNMFMRLNNSIPERTAFHTFFIDRSGKIIFIGDPTKNEKLLSIMMYHLKSKQE